jgi:DHA1 family solute carrier family 18 vesicular amine transporter 1/2
MVYLIKVADDAGYTDAESDSVVTCIGVGSILFRIPMMMLADKFGCHRIATGSLLLYGAANAVAAAVIGASSESLLLLQVLAVLSGGLIGALMSVTSPLVAECVPMRIMAQATGATYSCLSLGILLGAPLGGLLFEWTGDMSAVFVFAAVFLFAGAVILNFPCRWGSGAAADPLSRAP